MSTQAAEVTLSPYEQAIVWLKSLQKETWTHCHPGDRRRSWWRADRDLTQDEWERIQALIREHELPCTIMSGQFYPTLFIYEHSNLPEVKPESVLWVQGNRLPFPAGMNRQQRMRPERDAFVAFTHTPRNKELLAWYGFESLREPDYYLAD